MNRSRQIIHLCQLCPTRTDSDRSSLGVLPRSIQPALGAGKFGSKGMASAAPHGPGRKSQPFLQNGEGTLPPPEGPGTVVWDGGECTNLSLAWETTNCKTSKDAGQLLRPPVMTTGHRARTLSATLTLAPAAISALTESAWPLVAAQCKGVTPSCGAGVSKAAGEMGLSSNTFHTRFSAAD